MTRSVLLRHDLPDGSWHYDWLIDASGVGEPGERNVITFRLNCRPDESSRPFDAERLPAHRRFYLTHEGELPGGERGRVVRIAQWDCPLVAQTPRGIEVHLAAAGGTIRLIGAPVRDARSSAWNPIWRFSVVPG